MNELKILSVVAHGSKALAETGELSGVCSQPGLQSATSKQNKKKNQEKQGLPSEKTALPEALPCLAKSRRKRCWQGRPG